MDVSIQLEDGTYVAYGDVNAVILLEDNSYVMKPNGKRVESPFRIQITDTGPSLKFDGFTLDGHGKRDMGLVTLTKRPPACGC